MTRKSKSNITNFQTCFPFFPGFSGSQDIRTSDSECQEMAEEREAIVGWTMAHLGCKGADVQVIYLNLYIFK